MNAAPTTPTIHRCIWPTCRLVVRGDFEGAAFGFGAAKGRDEHGQPLGTILFVACRAHEEPVRKVIRLGGFAAMSAGAYVLQQRVPTVYALIQSAVAQHRALREPPQEQPPP